MRGLSRGSRSAESLADVSSLKPRTYDREIYDISVKITKNQDRATLGHMGEEEPPTPRPREELLKDLRKLCVEGSAGSGWVWLRESTDKPHWSLSFELEQSGDHCRESRAS